VQAALDVLLYGDKSMVYSHKSMDEAAACFPVSSPYPLFL